MAVKEIAVSLDFESLREGGTASAWDFGISEKRGSEKTDDSYLSKLLAGQTTAQIKYKRREEHV